MDYPIRDWIRALELPQESLHLIESVLNAIHEGDRYPAEEKLRELENKIGSGTEVLLLRYELEWIGGSWLGTLPFAQQLRQLHPDHPGSCCRLVQSLVGLGRFAEAQEVVRTASSNELSHHFNRLFATDLPYLEMVSSYSAHETGGVALCSETAFSALLQSDTLTLPEKTEIARVIGHYFSDKVHYSPPMFESLRENCTKHHVAILIPGRLRTFDLYKEFISTLSEVADFYVCVDDPNNEDIEFLKARGVKVSFYEDDPLLRGEAVFIQNAQLHQWLKYQKCVDMMAEEEARAGFRYDFVLKCRTDHIVAYSPQFAFEHGGHPRVFGLNDMLLYGTRDVMVTLRGVYHFALSECLKREANYYWKVRWETSRTYPPIWWSGFPMSVIGQPRASVDFFRVLETKQSELQSYVQKSDETLISLLDIIRGKKIDSRQVPEVWLARYLNLQDINYESASKLFGALISQRK